MSKDSSAMKGDEESDERGYEWEKGTEYKRKVECVGHL